ncbi:MAG TPA: beta-N-acetylhexosaminidase [Saprospiraceae bacterium]|nr:beta-N-acetylhexosaminidase [Saprospiraceae bacterium]
MHPILNDKYPMVPFFLILYVLMGFNCPMTPPAHVQEILTPHKIPGIIPQPVAIKLSDNWTKTNSFPVFIYDHNFEKDPARNFKTTLRYLKTDLSNALQIYVNKSDTISHNDGYHLSIKDNEIEILYSSEASAFYAFQSLIQLVPLEFLTVDSTLLQLPMGEIYDYPRFSYRGMHLDESRHFFGSEAVKKYIDMLAYQKMNYFHWHLTDDQGWRIEIKAFPKLTSVGGCREATLVGRAGAKPEVYDGVEYCHFYTQKEIKEIIDYAADNYITIVPEIEMPGHATAALAAYPMLSCSDKKIITTQKWGVFYDIFCPTEETFGFLEKVLTEVIDLFPGPYIHIGGDEVPKKAWKESAFCQELIKRNKLKDENELQSWFIQRIEKFVNSKGKKIIGWDEILEGGLAPNATVMSWRGEKGGLTAANQGHDVIMTPNDECYFDHYQMKDALQPLAIGGLTTLKDVYDYEPIPSGLNLGMEKHILGTQANLWAEYILTPEHLQYMAYPRSFALAEVQWSSKSGKNYTDFLHRLSYQIERLDSWKINYAKFYKTELK